MVETKLLCSSFFVSDELGKIGLPIKRSVSLIVVVTIKKNNNIKTISGSADVFSAGIPFFFFPNFDII
jgi:hypothetical protein